MNHALVLRLAGEFQGFCRDLHDEAVTEETASAGGGGDEGPLASTGVSVVRPFVAGLPATR